VGWIRTALLLALAGAAAGAVLALLALVGPATSSTPAAGLVTAARVANLPLAVRNAVLHGPISPTPQSGESVVTQSGILVGTAVDGTWRYLGIPYAAPPVGSLRWRPPQAPAAWPQPREAAAFGPVCPQYDADGAVIGDEDCLTLNVWAPREALPSGGRRPVLFFLHGGGHEQGSSSVSFGGVLLYDGRGLAADHGVVVVTTNYRLGPFGFLAHPALTAEGGAMASGNYGSLDQLAALRWIHDNIAAFGGDPANVTVFGQSAGSVSACTLVASPLAHGLLQRAALMSGGCVATTLARAEQSGLTVAGELGCVDVPDVTACLRARTTAEVMATLAPLANGTNSLARPAYDSVIDGYFLPAAPRTLIQSRSHNAVPTIVGSTSAENGRNAPLLTSEAEYETAVRAYVLGSGLPLGVVDRALAVYPVSEYASPRDAYVALTSDAKFVCQARTDARLLAGSQEPPVFRYSFDHVPDNGGALARLYGAYHGLDLPFLFGVLDYQVGSARYQPGPGDLELSAAMQGYWAQFAATGDPNGGWPVSWPRYEAADDPYLTLGSPPSPAAGLRTRQCDFWDALGEP
jgi:para-nitrobenzyl esterase